MRRRALIGTIATLGAVAVVGLFAALAVLFSPPSSAFAQTNSAPEFQDGNGNAISETTRSVDENTASFSNIGTPVTATDSDDTRLVYTLENARTSPFTIVRATGQLQVGQPLDYETKDNYSVKLIVTDSDGATDSIDVTINVNNVEEAGKVSLSWTKPQVDAEITASLTDPDGGISGESWQWARSSSKNGTYTEISTATLATYTPDDDDKGKYLRAKVTYTDGHGGNKTAQAVSARAVPTTPPAAAAPTFDVNTSGGYTCSNNEADVCLHVRRSAPAGSEIYYPARIPYSYGHEVRYSLEGADAGLFRIDPLRGDLYTTDAHAYDNPGDDEKFDINIIATSPSNAKGELTVVLRPSGGTGNPVVNGPSRITYPENGTWSVATYSATASDPLRDIEGWIIAVQPGGGDGDFFDIDDDGNLTFTQPPDFEDPADDNGDNTYSFSLHVYDTNPPSGERPAQTFFNVSVTVNDETVEALEIRGPSAPKYPENSTEPVATYRLRTPYATVNGVDWVLSGADGGEFSISDDGVLTFNNPPDYENPTDSAEENAYLVTITAYAGEASKTEFLRVQVTNVNEPPEFDEGATADRNVDRSTGVNQIFGDPVTATDPDGDSLTYTLPDAATLPFSISQYTGQLSVSGTIDRTRTSYPVAVIVTDNDPDNSEDDRIIVTVNVAGGGNNAPVFPAAAVSFSFNENTATVQDVGTPVTAEDDDTDDTLSYTLEGTDAGFFTIGNTSGQIQTKAAQTYDFETKRTYSVTVKADDSNGGTATKAVTINLNNLDEDGTVTLSTNQPSARAAITATLTDPDEGITGTTWQWAKSSDGNAPWTGVGIDSPSYTPPDADLDNYLRATASYTDGHGENKTAQERTTQKVQTGINRPADFSAASTTREVVENTAAGQPVGAAVTANDDDNDDLTYSMSGGDANLFDFETGTGQIKVKAGTTLDYEGLRNSYTVSVEVTDSKNADGTPNPAMDDSVTVTINVTDVNEPPAFDAATAARSIVENSAANTNVGAPVTAADPDTDASLTYSLSGTDADSFTIDSSGQIKVGASPALDYESAKKSYTVNVDVRDSKDAAGTADTATDDTIEVTINVTDVNEKPAFTDGAPATRNVPENTSAGQDIGNAIAAADPENDTLTYTLGGTDVAHFDIVGASGQLQTKSALDKETNANYTVTVSVHDGKNEAGGSDATVDATITVNITVTEENDPPEFSDTTATRDVAENTGAGVNVGQPLTATDDDTGDTLTYSLEGTDAASFDIDATNGQIKTKSGVTYNHEDEATYSVTVKVVDNKGGTDTIDVTVTVTDVNEKPTFDEGPTATRTVAENTVPDQAIGDPVEATDPDDDDTLTYSLDTISAAVFDIDTSSGQLKTKVTLDKETKASYTVTVSVHDGKNAAGSTDTTDDNTIIVTIIVTDANDPPEFSAASVTRAVPENTGAGENIGLPVTATDGDSDTLTYSLDTAGTMLFDIDSNSGQIKTKAGVTYDHEAKSSYSVTVRADDSNGGTDTIDVTITVTDVNEPPLKPGKPTVSRASSKGVRVTWTAPNNRDRPPIMHYHYQYKKDTESGWSGATFTTNGPITSVPIGTLDAGTSYDVQVQAINAEGPGPWSETGTGSTNSPPDFSSATPAREVDENTVGVTSVGAPVTATDANSDSLAYTLEGADANSFQIVSASGQIQTKQGGTYDHEAQPSYTVTVKANDGYGGTATIAVTITVTDVNEAPAFDDVSPTTRSIAENTGTGVDIGDPVTATDPDAGATLTYSLGGMDVNSFDIDTLTGQLKTKDALDHETKTTYTVIVSVRDSKDASGAADIVTDDTIDVTINITDANDLPEFGPNTATREVAENTAPNINIGSPVRATDADNDNLTYTLEGTEAGSFAIDESSGQLKTKSALDHETKGSYTVTVKASDGNNSVDTIDVTITITDVNEAPDFDSATATRTVPENTPAGRPVGPAVPAKDPDAGDRLT